MGKPLFSKVFDDSGKNLRAAIDEITKNMCREEIKDDSLEFFLAYLLVRLDNRPGLRSMGVEKVI